MIINEFKNYRCDDSVKNEKKPIAKASMILRKIWEDLPEKELHSLISRIITNVVEVKSVNTKHCGMILF